MYVLNKEYLLINVYINLYHRRMHAKCSNVK